VFDREDSFYVHTQWYFFFKKTIPSRVFKYLLKICSQCRYSGNHESTWRFQWSAMATSFSPDPSAEYLQERV